MNRQYWAYLKRLLLHKWYVAIGCFVMHVPIWRAILHDLSKFSPSEFMAYARQFHEKDGSVRKEHANSNALDTHNQSEAFNAAWIHHSRLNKHHWQAWVSIGNYGKLLPLPMPESYVREMIADWIGAGLAYGGRANPMSWYANNYKALILHEKTMALVEDLLDDLEYCNHRWKFVCVRFNEMVD